MVVGAALEIQSKPAHPTTAATSPTNAFTMTVSAVKAEEAAPVCWTGGGEAVRLTVALVPAAGVVVASAADDDGVGSEDALLDAGAEDEAEGSEAEGSEAELGAELELEPEPPGVMPPLFVPGSVLLLVPLAAAA
jgi:hypothetical protein